MTDVVVVGAGAAGLMAAGTAACRKLAVTAVERNPRPCRKVLITGKGRCNLTNDCPVEQFFQNIPRNPRFLYSSVSRFTPADTMRFFEGLGVALKTERGRRVFPQSDHAADIADALVRFARDAGVHVVHGRAVRLLLEGGRAAGVELEDGRQIAARAVVVATGGLSYPATGSTGDGYALARQAGHTIIPTGPSLVPLETQEPWVKDLMGLSLRNVALSAVDTRGKKTVYEELGELLFTHFGVSGPLILSASAHMPDSVPGRYALFIDLKPGLSPDQLDARLTRDFSQNLNRDFSNALHALLPAKLIPVAVQLSDIPADRKVNQVTREERRAFAALLKALPLTVRGKRPVEEAVVTTGGVNVREVDPSTMASKKVPGLYFAGELLDCDGYTGGFNLQIAFSTGTAAGRSVCL